MADYNRLDLAQSFLAMGKQAELRAVTSPNKSDADKRNASIDLKVAKESEKLGGWVMGNQPKDGERVTSVAVFQRLNDGFEGAVRPMFESGCSVKPSPTEPTACADLRENAIALNEVKKAVIQMISPQAAEPAAGSKPD